MNKLVNLLFTIGICLIVVSCSKETTINITVEKKQNLSLYMFDKGDINVLQAFEMMLIITISGCILFFEYFSQLD